MGHKDNLLRGARECLLSTGYAQTTVRDLVAASGANQASINYHYGSKEQLLIRALGDLNREWGEVLFAALDVPGGPSGATAGEHEARWQRIIDSIQANRSLWYVNFESVAAARRDDAIRAMIAEGQELARRSLARAFANLGDGADEAEIQGAGSHYYALLVGIAAQWLIDPEHAPTAAQIVRADSAALRA